MPKSRLFICGDCFTDWDVPEYHWTDYLKEHYDVKLLGKRGSDNISIMLQIGNLPEYKKGDRLIIYWTDPSEYQPIYRGKMKQRTSKWWNYSDMCDKDRITTLEKMKEDRIAGWENDGLGNEIKFIKKLKSFLFEYSPIYVTWNSSFYERAKSFTDLIQVSSFADETGFGEAIEDYHPGEKGCYDIYKTLLNKLGNTETPIPAKTKNKLL